MNEAQITLSTLKKGGRAMMFLGQASDLLGKYLEHPGFEEFESKNPILQELIRQIQLQMARVDTNHPLGQRCIRVNEETEKLFLEFAEICEKNLK